ncbi:DUF234 domain-containing protein [Campylobacter sp.]|uniref:DUF234 domain-containing protein n=1 Tax=Campylobacter sp. TaxID=205 RepID=UPI0026F79360|nr:DUF234 domain-containing protein [Campylobacter sp.]
MLKWVKKEREIYTLKSSYERFKHLEINELINFHCVFDGYESSLNFYDIFEAIEICIVREFDSLKTKFNFQSELEKEMKLALMRLAKSDRKRFNISKILPQPLAKRVYKELFERELLSVEVSLEKPIKAPKGQLLKKHLRRYKVEDKIRFKDNFTRFWFRFIEPNLNLLEEGKFDSVMRDIRLNFDDYASFGFELICRELLAHKFGVDVKRVSSLWTRDVEIDLFLKTGDQIIVGEAKFKEHKMCKNVLNLLAKKCERLLIEPYKFALFSKSGFSKELENLKDERVMLFEMKDFEELING